MAQVIQNLHNSMLQMSHLLFDLLLTLHWQNIKDFCRTFVASFMSFIQVTSSQIGHGPNQAISESGLSLQNLVPVVILRLPCPRTGHSNWALVPVISTMLDAVHNLAFEVTPAKDFGLSSTSLSFKFVDGIFSVASHTQLIPYSRTQMSRIIMQAISEPYDHLD